MSGRFEEILIRNTTCIEAELNLSNVAVRQAHIDQHVAVAVQPGMGEPILHAHDLDKGCKDGVEERKRQGIVEVHRTTNKIQKCMDGPWNDEEGKRSPDNDHTTLNIKPI